MDQGHPLPHPVPSGRIAAVASVVLWGPVCVHPSPGSTGDLGGHGRTSGAHVAVCPVGISYTLEHGVTLGR